MKGRALRRAVATSDALRVNADVPAIVSTTELVTPDLAREWLQKNRRNRPVKWAKVDEYALLMLNGRWRLHDQGIMFDQQGHLLTGQTRLWAVVKANLNVYMRVSRGNPSDSAEVIDRGVPQSARDLAARRSGRVHSQTEASLARAIAAMDGDLRPTKEALATILTARGPDMAAMLSLLRGQRKSREVLMTVAALLVDDPEGSTRRAAEIPILADQLQAALLPRTPDECWGRGAAFSLAMAAARRLVSGFVPKAR